METRTDPLLWVSEWYTRLMSLKEGQHLSEFDMMKSNSMIVLIVLMFALAAGALVMFLLKFPTDEPTGCTGNETKVVFEDSTIATDATTGELFDDLASTPRLARSLEKRLDSWMNEEVDIRAVAANANDQDLVDRVFSWLPQEVVEDIPFDSIPLVHNSVTGNSRVLWLVPLPVFNPDIHERPVVHRKDVLVVVHRKEGVEIFTLLRRDHRSWKYAPDDDQGKKGASAD